MADNSPPTSVPPESRLIFVLQVTFVATLIFGIVLFIRQYQSHPQAKSTATSPAADTVIANSTKPTAPAIEFNTTAPKNVPPRCVVSLQIVRSQNQPTLKTTGILVQFQQRCFLLCEAEALSKADWSQVRQIHLLSNETPWLTVSGPPQYIGDHTHNRQPNMLEKPDLAESIVAWPLEPQHATHCLPLADKPCSAGQPLWLVTNAPAGIELKRCRVVHSDEKKTVVESIDRFLLEDFPGCPLVDHEGKLASNHLGCSIVVITGASSSGIRRRLTSLMAEPPKR